jgi:hypothetical protein
MKRERNPEQPPTTRKSQRIAASSTLEVGLVSSEPKRIVRTATARTESTTATTTTTTTTATTTLAPVAEVPNTMSVVGAAIATAIRASGNASLAEGQAKYMRNLFPFVGMHKPTRVAVLSPLFKSHAATLAANVCASIGRASLHDESVINWIMFKGIRDCQRVVGSSGT